MRIAILGAGPSGLAVALALKRKGHDNIVIYEKEERVGGKSFSYPYKGKNFDLGSMVFGKDDMVARLADEFRVPYKPVDGSGVFLVDGKYVNPVTHILKTYSTMELLQSFLRFQKLVEETDIRRPGYGAYPAELSLPFSRYVKKHKIEPLAKAVEPVMTGFGYGYYEEIPAIYGLKFISSMLSGSFVLSWLSGKNVMCFFPGGWSAFWQKIARGFDIRLKADVTWIKRGPHGVTLTVNGRAETADQLVITSPLSKLEGLLDATPAEKTLFRAIRHYRVISTLIESTPLKTAFLVDNTRRARAGHVIGFENYHPKTSCYVAFQLAYPDLDLGEAARLLEADVEALGGKIRKIVVQKSWDYFYHLPGEAVKNGFYPKVEAMQGKKRTWYAGGVMNFETVGHCIEYADALVERMPL